MSNTRSSVAMPWWVLLIAIACALLLIAGAVIALVRPAMLAPTLTNPGQELNEAVRVYAGYLVSRNLAIAATLLGAVVLRMRAALSVLMVLAALVQLFDAGMDCVERRWALIPGVLVLSVLLLAAARRIGLRREA